MLHHPDRAVTSTLCRLLPCTLKANAHLSSCVFSSARLVNLTTIYLNGLAWLCQWNNGHAFRMGNTVELNNNLLT